MSERREDEALAILRLLKEVGSFYPSSIEIDVYAKDDKGAFLHIDGEEIERRINALLAGD